MENLFTTNENGVSLAINNLETNCITNPNNKFGIDSEGNIHANSISLVNNDITIGSSNYLESEEIEPGLVKLKDNQALYGTIIEQRSNSNGTYIKFSDGTMICYSTKSYRATVTQKLNDYIYYGYVTLEDFPHEFASIPSVTYSHNTSTEIFAIQPYNIESITTTNPGGVYPIGPGIRNEPTDLYITVTAIGKWK